MKKGYLLVVLILFGGIAYGSYQHAEVAPYRTVGPGEAYDLTQEGAYVLDVRTAAEFEEGHVPGAVNIPVEDPDLLSTEWGEVPSDGPVLVICRTGRRSAEASELLAEKGYTEVYDVGGGMRMWRAEGLPVEE